MQSNSSATFELDAPEGAENYLEEDEEDEDVRFDFDDLSVSMESTSNNSKENKEIIDVEAQIENLVMTQSLENSCWKLNVDLIKQLSSQELVNTDKLSHDNWMTLIVLSFMDKHKEYYATYKTSYQNGMKYLEKTLNKKQILTYMSKISQKMA